MKKKLKGTGVAIVTPFHKDRSIDFVSFEKLIEYLISNGIDYIVVMGTTGESVVLNKDEKNAIINFVVEIVAERVPVVIGLGGNNTHELLNEINSISFDGINAILSVVPYYNKPAQRGLYNHYKMLAEIAPIPLLLYNVPDRTGVNMTAETTLQLAHECQNIIGIKEASRNIVQCTQILKNRPEGFLLISGDDFFTLPLIALGADGVISVTANAFPKEFSELVKHARKGDFKTARNIQYYLSDFICQIFMEGNPSGIKAALDIMQLSQNYLRLPSVPVSRTLYNSIKNSISTISLQTVKN